MLSPTARRRIKKVLLWAEVLFILVMGAGMGVVLGAFYQMHKMLPPDSALDSYRPPIGTKIYSSDGELLAKLAAENREPVPLDRVPKCMQDAIVAIEDSRFYRHSGLDYRGLTRALVANITGRELAQGGSTITQQLARNMFLSSRKTLSRKIKEILLAVQIERNWTKRQILEAYLNQVYFGAGAYGVQSAARVYFNKDVKELTLPEAAMLAGLVQRPSELSPYTALREEGTTRRTKARRDVVLDRMAELGFISREDAEAAKREPIRVARERPRTTGYFKAKYFVQYVVDQLRDELKYDQDIIDKAGLTVITTLNWKMQQVAERVAREELAKIRRSRRVSEVALVCLDPKTGYIRAMVGGVNEPWEKYQFNCATQARRQPGSSFKLFVYAAAFEAGHTPNSVVSANSIPVRLPDGRIYAPKNHGRYGGMMTYTKAFAVSANGAAFNVAMKVGPRKVKEMALRLGLKGPLLAYPSIALGVNPASPLEMASAYSVFPAKGKRAEPIAILQVRSQDGEVLEEIKPRVHDTGLKPETIAYMDQLTRAVVTSGTGRAASIVPDAHGKTGTSEEYTDAWFIGYTPDLVAAVWAGNRDNSPMARVYGATIAVPIWARFMKEAVEIYAGKPKQAPILQARERRPQRKARRERPAAIPVTADGNASSLVRVTICPESGLLATQDCPNATVQEFLLGEQPLTRCTLHGPGSTHRDGGPSGRTAPKESDPSGTATPAVPPPAEPQKSPQREADPARPL